jgi:hypothetical protein
MYFKMLIDWWDDKDGLSDYSFWLLQLAAMKEDN